MGDITEDMLDGTCCQLCGQYFQNSNNPNKTYTHGYPVLCKECYDDMREEMTLEEMDEAGYMRAKANTL